MSVLVKNMKMPKDCEHCRFCGIDVESGCWIKKNWIIRKVGVGRPDWCPLIEIPTPHGRLIDADALEVTEKTWWEETEDDEVQYYSAFYEMETIEDAPTIIEAEE